jgi:hypothetical protein
MGISASAPLVIRWCESALTVPLAVCARWQPLPTTTVNSWMTSWLPSKGAVRAKGPARTGNLGRFCSGSYERRRGAPTVRPQLVPIAGRGVDHRSAVSERCSPRDQLGTTRYARCRTTCTSVNVTHHGLAAKTVGDQGKRVTATSWGSSGRRFKSCQPDHVKCVLTCDDRSFDTSRLIQLVRAWDHVSVASDRQRRTCPLVKCCDLRH